jgi:hypothetical protein
MIEYHEYGPNDKAPRYETSTADTGTSVAYGRCSVQLQQDDGTTHDRHASEDCCEECGHKKIEPSGYG